MDTELQLPGGTLKHKGGKLYEFEGEWSEDTLDAAPDNLIWIFGDNLAKSGMGGQAIIRRHSRAFGIPTKKSPRRMHDSYFRDEELAENKAAIIASLKHIVAGVQAGYSVVLSDQLYGTGLAKLHETAPWTFLWLCAKMNSLRAFLSAGVLDGGGKEEKEEEMPEIERLYHENRNETLQKSSDKLVTTKPRFNKKTKNEAQISMFDFAPVEEKSESALTSG